MERWPSAEEAELAAEVRRVTDRHCPAEVVRAAPDAIRAQHETAWKHLAGQLGVAGLGLPESVGGAGADVGALAVVVEEIGRAVAAVPFLSTVLAADLLHRLGANDLLPEVAAGELAITLAGGLDGAAPTVQLRGDRLHRTVGSVNDGSAASLLVVLAQGPSGLEVHLVAADATGLTVHQLQPMDLGRPQARVHLDGVAARRIGVGDATAAVAATRSVAQVLLAAEQCGIAARSLEIAVDHAKIRTQFGVPVGSFQAVKHLCADLLARTELARALLGAAVEATRTADPEAPVAVAAALLGCTETALAVTGGTIQVLGGIGFTWEHDAHLYYRRARANAVLTGPVAAVTQDLAGLLLAADGDIAPATPTEPGVAEFAAHASSWFAAHTTAKVHGRGGDHAAELAHLHRARQFRGALHAAGLAGVTVPTEYGGAGLGQEHEAALAAARRGRETFDDVFGIGTGMCVPVLLTVGTAAQKERWIAPLLRGEQIWCQLFSEPDAGSDLAALRTRAVATAEGGWSVTGAKVWTTYGQHADFALLLARTDPDVPKHKGITMFALDMKAPGITVRPLRQITGDSEFNEVFLDEVVLPADAVVGEIGGGWAAALVMLMNERVAIGRDPLSMSPPVDFARLRRLIADRGLGEDPIARARLVEVYLLERSLTLLGGRITAGLRPGQDPGPFASISKLGAAQLARLTTEAAFALAGAQAAAWDPAQADAGVWAYCVLFAPALGIAGGTDQIQRTIIAERLLGLPK